MSFQKKHAIRDLEAGSAAQDIDDNFDAIFSALRALRTQLDDQAEEAALEVPPVVGPMGPPGIPGEDNDGGYIILGMVGTGGSSSPGLTTDYVVLSDGGLPTPEPVDDGFGNFIYIAYTP